ncbi:hypothetical protein GCM10027592_01310 [Spirosoma flavus]
MYEGFEAQKKPFAASEQHISYVIHHIFFITHSSLITCPDWYVANARELFVGAVGGGGRK